MHIFIDESGIFSNPSGKTNSISCIAALVIPAAQKDAIYKDFRALKRKWHKANQEVKGSKLNEGEVSQVISMLRRYDVILDAELIDMGLHTDDQITKFKERQADNFIANLTPLHHPDIVKELHMYRDYFYKMSNPLFVQSFLLFLLVPRIIKNSLLFYSLRIPKELGEFRWVIDAKERTKQTDFEKAWSILIYLLISNDSFKEPVIRVEGGDYSYFEKFKSSDQSVFEDGIERLTDHNPSDLSNLSLKRLLGSHFNFRDSKEVIGLQLVDILVTTLRRAFNSTLKEDGWREIGSLMIRVSPTTLSIATLNTSGVRVGDSKFAVIKVPYYKIFEIIDSHAKSVWTGPPPQDRTQLKQATNSADRK